MGFSQSEEVPQQAKSQLNIEKLLEDHLPSEIKVLEDEILELESQLVEREMKLIRLLSIARRYNNHGQSKER